MDKIIDGLLFLIVSIYIVFISMQSPQWWDEQFPLGRGEPVSVLVLPSQTAREIASKFQDAGVVENSKELAFWMSRLGIDRKIKTGMYSIRKGSPWEVARQLGKATPFQDKMTLIPGSDIFSIAEQFQLTEAKELASLLLKDEFFDNSLLSLLPADAETRAAFLLPDTYNVAQTSPEALIQAGTALWWKKFGDRVKGNSPQEVTDLAILASLIEREAKRDEERALIAGVIQNRLKIKMPLQIDATVVYAWKREGEVLQRVLYKHLEVESPYNTYKKLGLPPTAICVPSKASWEAALVPEKTEYLYYVARKNGEHIFAKTYKDHLANIRKIRGEKQ